MNRYTAAVVVSVLWLGVLAPAWAGDENVILEPSQGRPVILAAGETFYFLMRLPPGLPRNVYVNLIHVHNPHSRQALQPTTPLSVLAGRFANLVLKVPADVPPGVYDLELVGGETRHVSRRSVRVVDRFERRFRFVHLSNMNVGDLTAPRFDAVLPVEVNLLAPAFIVATGDFTEWARLRDDASSWRAVMDYLATFDAPVYVVCGDHDHEASFTRYVGNSVVGTIDYGDYHGLLLLDHAGHPIERDADQLRWVANDLAANRNKVFNFIVGHSDELGLLSVWRSTGDVAKTLADHRIRMIITGGHVDWDGREFANRLAGLDGLHYVRTHQSSPCMRDKATGISHYRLIEVDGENVTLNYPDDRSDRPGVHHSIPSGHLRVFYDGANDGSTPQVTATVLNGLNRAFDDCRVWLRVAKTGGARPAVAGGGLVQALDGKDHWVCEVRVDLPDKAAIKVMAAANGQVPPPVPVDVELTGPRELLFEARTAADNLRYFHSDQRLVVRLTNQTDRPIAPWVVIRLNGTSVPVDPSVTGRWPIEIPPKQSIDLPLRLAMGKVSPGPHELMVYFLDDPLNRPVRFPVTLAIKPPTSQPER